MASITKNGENWRVQISVKGRRDSATFHTKAKATAWAAMRETELRTQAETGILAGKTVRDAFDKYAEQVSPTKRGERWETIRLNALAKFEIDGKPIGEMPLTNLTAEVLGRWRDARLKEVKASTFNRDMNLLANVLTTARKEWKWIAHNPTKDVRRPKDPPGRDRLITQEEIDKMCLVLGFDGSPPKTASQRIAVAFMFAIETGMRAGEICALEPGWVSGNVAHLPAAVVKNGVKRDVPLSKRAVELLELLPKDTLFELEPSMLDALFRKARDKTDIVDMHFHDTRHLAITRLSKKLDVLALARMVGHRDLKQLMRYYNESAADMAERLG